MWRRPEDQHAEVFLDAVKSVLDAGSDENEAARLYDALLIRDTNRGSAADHVVNLVLDVRPLAIGASARPDGQSNAQFVRSEKVNVAVTFGIARLGIELGNLECFHSTSQ